MAAARQSPGADAAQAASVGAGAECPAQEGQGQTTQPDAEKSAATLHKVLLCPGEKTKHYNPTEPVMYCAALQHIVLAEKHQGHMAELCPQLK